VRGKNREVGGNETAPVAFSTNFTIVLALSLYVVCLFVLFVCVFRSFKTKTETRDFNNQESINQLKGRSETTKGR